MRCYELIVNIQGLSQKMTTASVKCTAANVKLSHQNDLSLPWKWHFQIVCNGIVKAWDRPQG